MKKTKEQNKGITLIALVITIIVMLILVAVTISMAVNGGLFNYAGQATGDTKNAIRAEGQLGNGGVTIDNTYYNSIDEYLNKIGGTAGGTTEGGTTESTECKYCKDGLFIGYKCPSCNAFSLNCEQVTHGYTCIDCNWFTTEYQGEQCQNCGSGSQECIYDLKFDCGCSQEYSYTGIYAEEFACFTSPCPFCGEVNVCQYCVNGLFTGYKCRECNVYFNEFEESVVFYDFECQDCWHFYTSMDPEKSCPKCSAETSPLWEDVRYTTPCGHYCWSDSKDDWIYVGLCRICFPE